MGFTSVYYTIPLPKKSNDRKFAYVFDVACFLRCRAKATENAKHSQGHLKKSHSRYVADIE